MEKFALLNLLKALDELSGKNPADKNADAGQNFNADEGFGAEQAADNFAGGADAGNPFGGILGNLLNSGLFGGTPPAQHSAGNISNQNGDADFNGANPLYEPPRNVMASVLERHEYMSNRLKNKK